MGKSIKLDSLVDPNVQQVILSFSRNDYFALRIFFSRLDKENLLGDEFCQLVDRFNNSIIDIVDCSGTSLFDSQRV